MDHLLYVLDCIEELLRELMLAEVRGATKELKGFDRLRTQNRVYDRTLTPRDRFTGSVPVRVRSLPGLSRESSTEPMDTDKGVKTLHKIVESIRVARG